MSLEQAISKFDDEFRQCDVSEVNSDLTVRVLHLSSMIATTLLARQSTLSAAEKWIDILTEDFEVCLRASIRQFFLNDTGAPRNAH